jgi:hypothetical protein
MSYAFATSRMRATFHEPSSQCYVFRPVYPPRVNRSYNIGEEYKLRNFRAVPLTFLGSDVIISILFANTLNRSAVFLSRQKVLTRTTKHAILQLVHLIFYIGHVNLDLMIAGISRI